MSLIQSPSQFWTRLSLAKQWLIQATTPGELVRVGKAANKVLQDAAKTAEWALEDSSPGTELASRSPL